MGDEMPHVVLPHCTMCGRFCGPGDAQVEYGDYGTVNSVEYVCARCSDPGYRCCGEMGGCGGPCAAIPCWELTT